MTQIQVVAPGPLTTIQDLGRPGWAHIGVPRSGAADRASLKLANRLVGNAEGAAGLETTLVGPRLRFDGDAVLALTGAPVNARVADRRVPMNESITLSAGEELRVGSASDGLRTYIAIAGGIDAPRVLGSAASDVLTGLGPEPLTSGGLLTVGGNGGGRAARPPAPEPPPPFELPDPLELRVVVGPRSEWLDGDSISRLFSDEFTVNHASNRIGLRLEGPALVTRRGELPSEALVTGAIQVPPDGHPIVMLADHPTTGGYPVVAVVHSASLRLVAQLRPGRRLRFSTDDGDR